MSRARAFDDQQSARIAHLYCQQNLSVERIAERFESNPMAVWRTLKRSGVDIRYNPRQNMIPAATLRDLYWGRKMSTVEIAARYHTNKETIRKWMVRHGIPARTKTDAALLSPSEWTDDRLHQLRELWPTGMTGREIKAALGIAYGPRAIYAKAKALGLPARQEPRARPATLVRNVRPAVAEEPVARAVFVDRTIISFAPENQKLELMWLTALAEVKQARGAA